MLGKGGEFEDSIATQKESEREGRRITQNQIDSLEQRSKSRALKIIFLTEPTVPNRSPFVVASRFYRFFTTESSILLVFASLLSKGK